jgi:tRNA-2-methylthio-N6-dimethylallyladenosine synthase
MFGCSFQCTFCAVPTARGAERSRSPQQVLGEIDELVSLGYHEITLLGQTVNAYGRDVRYRFEDPNVREHDRCDFAWLLEQINERASSLRVRFTSPHPQLFTRHLIKAIAELPTVCEHIHLPLQSGDDQILRQMKRNYTFRQYRTIVEKLRQAAPDISISTDLIVGFPGETEDQFQATLRAVEEIQFDQAFMFAYSPRRHTEAWDFAGTIAPEIQKQRLQVLIELVNTTAQQINRKKLGRLFEVLVEGPSEKNPERLCGRTRTGKLMIFDGSRDLIGKLVQVRADRAFLWGFSGEVVGTP